MDCEADTANEKLSSTSWEVDDDAQRIEKWLDQHPYFLNDYLRCKGLQFHDFIVGCASEKQVTLEFSPPKEDLIDKQQNVLQIGSSGGLKSGTETPVRKISSHDFDLVGSKPILTTTSDGLLTFISPNYAYQTEWSSHGRKSRRRSEIRTLDERLFMHEIILDICHDLDMTSLAFKILQNVCLLLDADRCSLFLLEEDRISGQKVLVSKLFDVTADSTLDENVSKCRDKKITVSLEGSIMGAVALSGNYLNIQDAYKDERFNHEIDQMTGYVTKSILCMPLKDSDDVVFGVAQAVNKVIDNGQPFSDRDVQVFQSYLAFCGIGMRNAQIYQLSQLETRRNQVLLDLARLIFEEQSDLSRLIHKIMMHTQSLLQCDRCQVLLLENNATEGHFDIFSQVYELSAADNQTVEMHSNSSSGQNFPLNMGITNYVAHTGETVNIRNAYEDDRFDQKMDAATGYHTKAILCMPIRNSKQQVIGVCQLFNKLDGSCFTKSDQNLFEAFALFCGLGIDNAQMYEQAMRAMARQRVALEVLSYHAIATYEEAVRIKKMLVPTVRYFKLTDFSFTDFSFSDDDTLRACLRMFIDLDLLRHFHISYTACCRWLLSVKKNYRPVTYHNWRHAFNVAQTMFAIIKNANLLPKLGANQCLGLLIACLCHDLDHRGTNNQFQFKIMSPLAELYSTSVLEHHHFDQCVMILNTKGTDILANMDSKEYSGVIRIVEQCILSTDLARYFAKRKAAFELLQMKNMDIEELTKIPPKTNSTTEDCINWTNESHVETIRSMLMTACDVAAITKPWPVQWKIAKLVASEFFEQGDIEKSQLNITPQEMMDRDKEDQLPRMQVDFIDHICLPVYQAIVRISTNLSPLLEGCLDNREHWQSHSELFTGNKDK